jgi:RNA polymerase sigma factor (sigma-70 family)
MKVIFGKANAPTQMDENDFSRLFTDYQKLVYRTAYLILGAREEAEDALQDVFLKIYESFGTFDPSKGAFSTWVYRITVNYCIKKKTRLLWRFLPLLKAQDANPASPAWDLEDNHFLLEALSQLTIDQRVLVTLRYGWQLSYEEIAQITGKPLGTIKSRHARVIEILQKTYNFSGQPAQVEKRNL